MRRERLKATVILATTALALACVLPAAASAATQTLTVEVGGTGSGTVTSFPAGINCGATCSSAFTEGAVVTLTGIPTSGSAAVVWSGCETITAEKKCKVTMSAAKTVKATFDLAQRELKVERKGAGTGTVTSSPAGINCGTTCSASYANATVVTLSAVSGPSTAPVVWSGCAKVIEAGGEKLCEVTMSAAKAITAIFNLNQIELKVTKGGLGTGTVKSTPAGIECGVNCAAKFGEGTTVTLSGTPGPNTLAVQWSGCSSVDTEGKCLVTMSGAREVTAIFNVDGPQLTVSRAGPGPGPLIGTGPGTVTSSPAGIACGGTCAVNFVSGTTVTLSAADGLDTELSGWSGCDAVTVGNECEVTMSANKAVTAIYKLKPTFSLYTVSVQRTGTGSGTVTSSPAGIDCGSACAVEILSKATLALTATPDPGSVFDHWAGGGCTGTAPTCEKQITSTRTVKAVFTAAGTRTLAISLAGTGSGTVKSKAAGIDCSTSCSPQVAAGTKVTLSAKAASGSTFSGWSGVCAGVGPCKVTMSEAHSVTATFARPPNPSATGKATVANKARVKGGKALVRVSCGGPASCRGSLKLLAKLKGKGKATVIGSATFSLAPGSSTTLKIKLSAKAKQALKRGGKLKARVSGDGIQAHALSLKLPSSR